jgi:ketosteroid isomerase-like protein
MTDLVQRLVDENAIRRLALRYAACVDAQDANGFMALFAPDAVLWSINSRKNLNYVGSEEIGAVLDLLKHYEKTYHMVFNHLIEFDAQGATGVVYSTANHLQRAQDGGLSAYVTTITYRDRYARDGDGWLFANREINTQFIETRPVGAG